MKPTARTTKLRSGLVAAAAVAVLTTTGCSYISPQQTAEMYAPSDGIEANLGNLELRNVLIVSEDSEKPGRVIGTAINTSDKEAQLTIDNGAAQATVTVPANGKVVLEDSDPGVLLSKSGAEPGLMTKTVFTDSSSGEKSGETSVPVLDHTYPQYAKYVPGGAPTTLGNPSMSPSAEEEAGHGGH